MRSREESEQQPTRRQPPETPNVSRFIDWYAKGEGVIVEANGNRTIIRIVDRKGRRDRLAVSGPPGATFRLLDRRARDETGEEAR